MLMCEGNIYVAIQIFMSMVSKDHCDCEDAICLILLL